MTNKQKKLFIKTYGCQMNVYDSFRMADALAPHGFAQTMEMDDADLILLNTCHIREKASEKVFSELGRLKKLQQVRAHDGKKTIIGIAGCVAQAEGEEIMARAPMVDLVFGPQSYHRLPEMVAKAETTRVVDTDFPEEDKFEHLPRASRQAIVARGLTAFLTIQEGCDKFCSFCVVPYTRGNEMSRPVAQIIAEAQNLAAAGVREITLLGQNVNAYHGLDAKGNNVGLGALLFELAKINGLERLRYTTSHPRDMNEELIAAHRDLKELMPYLHLPVQSGSDKILKAMNRGHSRADYLSLVERIRAARPDIALSGDFIVGFPGESEDDFNDTLSLIEEVGYASAFSFKYSPRPGTPGSLMSDQVEEKIASERLMRLQDLVKRQQNEFNQGCVGTAMDVLLERKGRKKGQLAGRSPFLQAVHVDAPSDLVGTIAPLVIKSAGPNSLYGQLLAKTKDEPATVKQKDSSPDLARSHQA